MLYQHNASPCILLYQVHGQNEDPCKGVVCPRGRMCWSSTDSGENYTTCECPKECSADPEPVCTMAHKGLAAKKKKRCKQKKSLQTKK